MPSSKQMSPALAGLVLRLQEWSRNCLIDGLKMDKGEPTLQALLREAYLILMRSQDETTAVQPDIAGEYEAWIAEVAGDTEFCTDCVDKLAEYLKRKPIPPEEPSESRESDWHCVHCGRDNDPSETHCVQCEWSRKHTIAGVLHERGCFDHPCICGAVKALCSRCGGSQVDPDPDFHPCKQCCPKTTEVRASDPHDGITPCPPESRCVECWPEKASARPIPPGRMCNTHGNWNCSECCPPENGTRDV